MNRYVQMLERLKLEEGFPRLLHAELHPTDRCNLNCYFCNQTHLRKRGPEELPTDLIIKTLKEMNGLGLRSVRLSGGGEPTLSPAFPKIMDYLKTNGIALTDLTTNGLLLDKRCLKHMAGVDWQSTLISLSTCGAENWHEVTGGSEKDFNQVIENIKRIVAMRHETPAVAPSITVSLGIDIFIYKDLISAYKFIADLGVDALILNAYNHIVYPEEILADRNAIVDQIEHIIEINNDRTDPLTLVMSLGSLKLNETFITSSDETDDEGGPVMVDNYYDPCFMPWYGTTIQASGNVIVCCAGSDAFFPVMGNIHEESIKDIWKGKLYEELRSRFESSLCKSSPESKGKEIPPRCRPNISPNYGCPIKIDIAKLLASYR